MEQLFDAGIRLEDKEQLDLEDWLLPGDVDCFSMKRAAGGASDLPKKRTRITLRPNACGRLYKDLKSLSGKWYDDRGSTYVVRIAEGKGYVATSFVSRKQKVEQALITVATDLEKITWPNPYGEDPPTYELCIEDIDHVTWTWFEGCRPKCSQFIWRRIRD